MSTERTIYHQYRTFDHLYMVESKKGGTKCVVKVFDVFQRIVLNKVFSGSCKVLGSRISVGKESTLQFLREILPQEYLPKAQKEITKEECGDDIHRMINQYKSNIVEEPQDLKDWVCPITLEMFLEPVDDEHGHTFEKTAIEEHLKTSNECPLSREPITSASLRPNRRVQEEIEKRRNNSIPNFSLFEREKANMASRHLNIAQALTEEQEYEEALVSYAQAFRFTRNWSDYAKIPQLYEKLQEREKATLAYLYLALYQLEDGKNSLAMKSLVKCSLNKELALQAKLLLGKMYELEEEKEKALQMKILQIAELSKQNPQDAISLCKKVLNQGTEHLELYLILANLLEDSQYRSHILLKGATHAIELQEYNMAKKLCAAANRTSFEDTLVFLEVLESKEELLSSAVTIFEEKEMYRDMLKASKMLFQNNPTAQYCEKIVRAYEKLKKPQNQLKWTITLLGLLIKEENWSKAEEIAKQALQQVEEVEKITIYEKLETIYSHWHGYELSNLLNKLGKAYLQNNQLDAAEKTYRKAYEKFHTYNNIIRLAEVLDEKKDITQSVKAYYEASTVALVSGDYQQLSLCIKKIQSIEDTVFEKTSTFISILKDKEEPAFIEEKLFSAAKTFEENKMHGDLLIVAKILYESYPSARSCEKIVTAYEKLENTQKQSKWTIQLLADLINEKNWVKAEEVANQALEKFEKIPIYKKLETIYSNWHDHKLSSLMGKMAEAYLESCQLDAAEKTYRRAFKEFHTFEHAIGIAEALKEKKEIKQSVKAYYQASSVALLSEDYQKLTLCVEKIQSIDPKVQELSENERMHLLTQKHILSLSTKLSIVEETLKAERERPYCVIGKAELEKFLGEVGEEPPYPSKIKEILRSPCPYWSGCKVEQTHILVLIPETINGIPLTLKHLMDLLSSKDQYGRAFPVVRAPGSSRIAQIDLEPPKDNECYARAPSWQLSEAEKLAIERDSNRVQSQRKGFYNDFNKVKEERIGTLSSHWVLMTKDVVPKTLYKEKSDYSYWRDSLKQMMVPEFYEIALGRVMQYFKTGEVFNAGLFSVGKSDNSRNLLIGSSGTSIISIKKSGAATNNGAIIMWDFEKEYPTA